MQNKLKLQQIRYKHKNIQYQMDKQQKSQPSTKRNESLGVKITESMRKKFFIRQFYFSLYHLFRIALSISIIILICKTNLEQIKNNYYYARIQEILELWNKNVIVDMITVSSNNCPQNYEPYTSASWVGTKEGCLCATTLNSYDFIHGQCTSKLINAGCTKVNRQKSIPFTFWKPNQLICVKRIKGLTFYTHLQQLLSSAIIRKCAAGQTYQFESLTASSCPITALANTSSAYTNKLPTINFSYSREISYPIIDIKMSEYRFCLEYNRSNISPHRFGNYDLQLIPITHCQRDKDPRVQEIDQQTEKQLFNNNPRILDIVVNELPVYPIPSNSFVYLLGVTRYPPWTYQCRKSAQFNLKNVHKVLQFTQNIDKSKICMYLTILMISLWGFLYSIAFVFQKVVDMRNRYRFGVIFYPDELLRELNPNLMLNTIKLPLPWQLSLFLFLNLIGLAMLIQLGVSYQSIGRTDQWLRSSFRCMDGSAYFKQWVEQGYLSTIQTFTRTYLICILEILIAMVIDVIFLVWRFHRGDLVNFKIKNIFVTESEKSSDEGISEDVSQGKGAHGWEHQISYGDGREMQQVNEFQIQTIEAEILSKQREHRDGKSQKKQKYNRLTLVQKKKQQSQQNIDIITQKNDRKLKKVAYNKQKNNKNKPRDIELSKQHINHFEN